MVIALARAYREAPLLALPPRTPELKAKLRPQATGVLEPIIETRGGHCWSDREFVEGRPRDPQSANEVKLLLDGMQRRSLDTRSEKDVRTCLDEIARLNQIVTIVESELFGHEKGAFTRATARREERFEVASEGTLFLDEIAERNSGRQLRHVSSTASFLQSHAPRRARSSKPSAIAAASYGVRSRTSPAV